MRNINKSFHGVKVLSDVSAAVEKGEIHAIVGENGAGKSTLMKILGGLYSKDSGELLINGKSVEFKSIHDALAHGISVIYQELNLMPALTVAENIFVSGLPGKMGAVNYRELNRKTQALIDSLSLSIKPGDYVSMLSVSQRQMVEILKAMSHNAEIIIMDEPTAALNNQEVNILYEIIHKLNADGKTILYISHRLKEIFDLADRVTVLRDGKYVGTREIGELDENGLVSMMVGRDISKLYEYKKHEFGGVLLKVEGLTREGMFSDVSFTLRAGEVAGMAGLMGCGREEIVKSIYGLIRRDAGSVTVHGKTADIKNPRDAIQNGIGFVTEDRKDAGIFAQMTVRENIVMNILKKLSRFGIIDSSKENGVLGFYKKSMNMRFAGENQRIMFLSGGNQQKFVLSRALAANCDILIMLEPTRGIDVGAKAEIYSLLADLAVKGMAILVVSSELPEIISICHRTLVIFEGRITGNIAHDEMDENLIMLCATGKKRYFSEGLAV
jgi:ABC-type sugar transport system ATPase subunit